MGFFVGAWLGIVLTLVFVPLRLRGQSHQQELYSLWFGLLFVGACGLALRVRTARTATWWAYAVAALILVGALSAPLHVRLVVGDPQRSRQGHELTAALWRGLTWVRNNAPGTTVVAVNNYYLEATNIPLEMSYSAFAERRVFLGGWAYASTAGAVDVIVPPRLRLNEAVFKHADATALQTLTRRYAVRYLLVDQLHGDGVSSRLAELGCLVYSNRDVLVYQVFAGPRLCSGGRLSRGGS
jgi:hypothetical protein